MTSQKVQAAWTSLLDKDDRNSPAEYPDMCLITRDELAALLAEAEAGAWTWEDQALADIAAECRRHVEVEGWTPEHDDGHAAGALAKAGGLYAQMAIRPENDFRYRGNGSPPPGWPWEARWWKAACGPRRMLVKAASLIVAEIRRIDRQGAR